MEKNWHYAKNYETLIYSGKQYGNLPLIYEGNPMVLHQKTMKRRITVGKTLVL